jgi:SSS family solute:Na+ symporter
MGIVFLVTGFLCYMTALLQGYEDQDKAIILEDINFLTSKGFNISAFIIFILLTIIYTIWW